MPEPTPLDESRRRIRAALRDARRVAVGTHAGEEVRVRMMHPGAWLPDDEAERPLVYLASMKTDPKIREMSTRPEVALLLHESPDAEEASSWEMEITGRAEVVRDAAERERAKQARCAPRASSSTSRPRRRPTSSPSCASPRAS
jgi:nitroimidazol reductase NimA-like FMN-containing flavoprotein (pyridoxamine 5'-phosphate oxidase superfamily)